MRQPDPPPQGLSPLDVADYYLRHYEADYYRTRRVVKGRANLATVGTAIGSGAVAVLAAISAALSAPDSPSRGLSIATAAVSAAVSILTAWDAHFQHRRHWIKKTPILQRLTKTRMWFEAAKARGEDQNSIAATVMATLDNVFDDDLRAWDQLHDPNEDDKTPGA